jgi:DNA-binding IclR family transcriptional regulator
MTAPRGRGLARGLPGEYRALLVDLPDEPVTAAALARQLGIPASTLAGRLVTLAHRGLVTYERQPGHRRAGTWRRTPAGADLAAHLRRRP